MSWLRWWDGTCVDPKWRVVAARSGQPVGAVVSIWAWLLEQARPNDGRLGEVDCETIAVTYGYEVEAVEAIVRAMADKGLIDGLTIKAWSKRQPKREDDSRERVAAWRAAKRAETQNAETRNAPVTRGNAPEAEAEAEAEAERGIGSSGFEEKPSEPRPIAGKPAARTGAAKARNSRFEEFWRGYPTDKNMAKAKAAKVWERMKAEDQENAIHSLPNFRAYCRGHPDYRPVHAVKYLSERRYDGHISCEPETKSSAPSGIWLAFDSPQFEAWKRYRKSTSGQSVFHYRRDGEPAEGNFFPTEWPPGAGKVDATRDVEIAANGRIN